MPRDVKIKVGQLFTNNKYGPFVILSRNNYCDIKIRFIKTGHERSAMSHHIKNGAVKDPYFPSVHGVGYYGVGKYKAFITKSKKSTKQYKTWIGMLERCYSEKLHKKHPTYIGCTVCDEWLNFQNFAEWFDENYIEGLSLDKDIKINGNKKYSPYTCLFVSREDNSIKANAKTKKMTSPNGEIISIYNMTKFCKDNGLDRNLMKKVFDGKAPYHKGWTKAE